MEALQRVILNGKGQSVRTYSEHTEREEGERREVQVENSLYSLVELPCIWMMHLDSLLVSRELKGLTRTATFTEAPDILVALYYICSPGIKVKPSFEVMFKVPLKEKQSTQVIRIKGRAG